MRERGLNLSVIGFGMGTIISEGKDKVEAGIVMDVLEKTKNGIGNSILSS